MTFGTTSLGYAFKASESSNAVLIPNELNPTGSYASLSNPGAGWIGVAVCCCIWIEVFNVLEESKVSAVLEMGQMRYEYWIDFLYRASFCRINLWG
jgi:hypothetical protein